MGNNGSMFATDCTETKLGACCLQVTSQLPVSHKSISVDQAVFGGKTSTAESATWWPLLCLLQPSNRLDDAQ